LNLRDLQISPPEERAQLTTKFLNINTKLEAKQYLEEVRQKVKVFDANNKKASRAT
jgi:hypothetical protein